MRTGIEYNVTQMNLFGLSYSQITVCLPFIRVYMPSRLRL